MCIRDSAGVLERLDYLDWLGYHQDTLLSAMMAVELRARMEEGRDADTRKAK